MARSLVPAPGAAAAHRLVRDLASASAPPETALDIERWMVLRDAPLFDGLPLEAVDALCAEVDVVDLARGQVLFAQGDAGDELFVVLRGKVKLTRRTHDGRQALVAITGPADQFGELSVFDPGPRTATAKAMTPAQLARFESARIHSWAAARPYVTAQLLRVVARRLRRTNSDLSDLVFVDLPGRLAKLLLDLAGRFGARVEGGISVDHDLTQGELAQLLGATRETVNKALSDFAARGWIRVETRSVLLCDPDRLAKRAKVALDGRHPTF